MKSINRKELQQNHNLRKHIIRFVFYIVLGIICLPFGMLFAIKTGIIAKLPDKTQLEQIQNYEASTLYSADKAVLGRYYLQNRTVLTYDQISKNLVDALIATEDERFYEHHGIDFRSLSRVLFRTFLLQDRSGGGGSTITQQLAKNIYGRETYPYFSMVITKLREMLIAFDIEKIYSKQDILTMYMNTVPFGENLYGVESASQRFFQEKAANLNIQQASLLIGMLKANSYYNPKNYPQRALTRRNVVMAQLHRAGKIDAQALDSLQQLPIELHYKSVDQNDGIATYFREHIRQTLKRLLPHISDSLGKDYNLYTDGLKIYTTLDAQLQMYAEKAVYRHMRALQSTFDKHWSGRRKPWENESEILTMALHQSMTYQNLKNAGLSEDSIKILVNTPKDTELYSWQGKVSKKISTMDSIKFYLQFLNTGVLSVDPHNGGIKVWVGGINYRHFKYDHVNRQSRRQVGSTFKPIVYAAALEQNISPCTYIKAEQEVYEENDHEWKPGNADDEYEGKYSMEGALTSSINTVSVKILQKAGIDHTIELAKEMGISSKIPAVPSIALGTPSISLEEMVEAYCTFAARGKHIRPYLITKIEDRDGHIIWQYHREKQAQVLSLATSQIMIEMLKNVVNAGTGIRLRKVYNLPNDIAGKTGTTQDNADGWFMAITPRLVTGVWVGGEYPSIHFRTTALGQGANMALPIYALFQQQINRDRSMNQLSRAIFPPPPRRISRQLECDPFKEEENFWQSIFGKKDTLAHPRRYSKKPVPQKREKGFFKKFKKLFKRTN